MTKEQIIKQLEEKYVVNTINPTIRNHTYWNDLKENLFCLLSDFEKEIKNELLNKN